MVTSLLAQITAFLNLNCNKISKIAQQESTDQFESMICTWPWIEAEREMLVRSVVWGPRCGERSGGLQFSETWTSLVLKREQTAEVERSLNSPWQRSWGRPRGRELPPKDAFQLTGRAAC